MEAACNELHSNPQRLMLATGGIASPKDLHMSKFLFENFPRGAGFPDVPLPQIPTAFLYLGCWFLMAGAVYYFFGMETKGKSIDQIDKELAAA